MKKANDFPPGLDDERVQNVIRHYESQTEDEAIAERQAAFLQDDLSVMVIPTELLAAVWELLNNYELHCPKGSAIMD